MSPAAVPAPFQSVANSHYRGDFFIRWFNLHICASLAARLWGCWLKLQHALGFAAHLDSAYKMAEENSGQDEAWQKTCKLGNIFLSVTKFKIQFTLSFLTWHHSGSACFWAPSIPIYFSAHRLLRAIQCLEVWIQGRFVRTRPDSGGGRQTTIERSLMLPEPGLRCMFAKPGFFCFLFHWLRMGPLASHWTPNLFFLLKQ